MMLVSGIGNTFPVFFPSLLAEFGGSRGATAFGVTLLWIGGAVLGPVAGRLVDRGSPRRLVALGLAAAGLGLGAAALAPSLALFTLGFGVGGGIGVGLTGMVTQAAVIAAAYRRRRGFATGIAFSGSMAGYVLATPAQWAIDAVGWRGTLAAYVLVIAALVPLVLRVYPARLAPREETVTAGAPRGPATLVGTPAFWLLVVVFSVAPFVGYLATVQHALYFRGLGFDPKEAAAMLMVGGLLATAGRALAGLAADRIGAPATGLVSYSLTLLGVLCLIGLEIWPGRPLAYLYVLFLFVPLGTRATIVAVLVPRIAPPGRYGSVFGLLSIGNSLGAALGPWLSGALYDWTGSYLAIWLFCGAVVAIALGSLALFVRLTTPRTG